MAGIHVAQRRVFPSGDKDGQVLFSGGQQPTVFGIDLIGRLEVPGEQNPVYELVRKEALAGLVGADPFLQHFVLNAPHRLHLRDAGIGNPVHVAAKQLGFVGWSQIAVVRNALVEVVRHEVENVFLKICAGAADAMNLLLADHLGER